MNVVIDSNVAIAAVASRGLCEAVMELCLERHRVVLCEGILDEIGEKLKGKLGVPETTVAEYIAFLRETAAIIEPAPVDRGACRDPKDLMVLGLVAPGSIDAVLTGDRDLLVLGEFGGARILTPREFWDLACKPPVGRKGP